MNVIDIGGCRRVRINIKLQVQINIMDFFKKYSFPLLLVGIAFYFLGRYLYMQPKVVNGENAPIVAGKLLDGSAFDIKELRGKYVLVDFWGSWCGPCLKEIPGLKKVHAKYQKATFKEAAGLTIVSIAIERDEKRWTNAVQRTGMNWKHHLVDLTSSLRFLNSPLAQEFGVKQVPSKFLLNEDGVIIGVNQSMEELDAFLERRLK